MVKFNYLILAIVLFCAGCNKRVEETVPKKPGKTETTLKPKERFDNFIFVGKVIHQPGLYKYDFVKKKSKEFWSNFDEKVVELSYSPERKSAFFITAGHYGKKNIFPYITRVKVYLVDLDSSKIKLIKRVGNGIQVFVHWENSNNFKVVINRINKIVATYIEQQTFIYNTFGKELLNETKTYDLTESGYPRPAANPVNYLSPFKNYQLINESPDSTNLYLNNIREDEIELVYSNSQQLNKFRWALGEKYFIFSTVDLSAKNKTISTQAPFTSGLYIYDISQKKIINKWEGAGIKNFFIVNDLLIFDDGFGANSTITIFNLETMTQHDSLKINGGCGLKNIPEIPKNRT